MQISKAKHKQLIDAANLLCEFVGDNLPEGFTIELTMGSDEAFMSLLDPFGDEIDTGAAEYNVSHIAQACEIASEIRVGPGA